MQLRTGQKRFLETTRGQLLTLLRRGPQPIDALAAALDLTPNAIRAHMTALERDGLVRPRGTVVLKTTIAGTQTLSLAPVVVDEVTVVGSRCGPFDRALDALANGLVDVEPLISDRFDLSDGVRALERAAEPGVLKVLLTMDVDA